MDTCITKITRSIETIIRFKLTLFPPYEDVFYPLLNFLHHQLCAIKYIANVVERIHKLT